MTDLPPYRTPRWVRVLGIIVIAVVLLFGILHLTGNTPGGHIQHPGLTGHGQL